MKIKIIRELHTTKIRIDSRIAYGKDYQAKMLEKNKIEALLGFKYCTIDGMSSFLYNIGEMKSMKDIFKERPMGGEDITRILEEIIALSERMENYLLRQDCLILNPAYIFCRGEKWHFLYLPIKQSGVAKSFHELSEYFLSTIDYQEKEAIGLASFLHKETLGEHFSLSQIWQDYKEKAAQPGGIFGQILASREMSVQEALTYEESAKEEGHKLEKHDLEEYNLEEVILTESASEWEEETLLQPKENRDFNRRKQKRKPYILESESQEENSGSRHFWARCQRKKVPKEKREAKQKRRWGDWGDMITEEMISP